MSDQSTPNGRAPTVPAKGDRGAGVTALAFCAAVYALTYTFDEVPQALMSGLGAELFPRLVLGTMALLSVLIALGIGVAPPEALPPLPMRVWATGAVLFGFLGAVELIGMWASCFLVLVGLGRMWGERSLVKLSLNAIGLCVVLYLLFVGFLGVTFPRSILGSLWS